MCSARDQKFSEILKFFLRSLNFPTQDSTDDAMQLIFTDFKRINETHFWSVSSKKWLHQLADKDSDNGASYWYRAPYKGPG